RRLVERGVRFVQIFLHSQPWDTHSKNAEQLKKLCAMTDQPSAALVTDLKRRGLLDSTIVLWTGEFGRLPVSQGGDGRDHHRHALSVCPRGGGSERVSLTGAPFFLCYNPAERGDPPPAPFPPLANPRGFAPPRLTYPHDGRDDSLTDEVVSHAKVVPELLDW